MTFVRLLPVVLAFLLLAAHFSRAGVPALSVAALLVPVLLLVKRRWAALALQALLLAGAAEWVRAVFVYVGIRRATGAPWLRLVLILGPVALLTAAACLVFRNAAVRKRFAMDTAGA